MQQKKYIFQILHKEIKLAPKVLAFADDTNENSIDIYIGEDRPDIGLNTYSTIGLSKFPVDLVCSDGREIRVEYIGMCNSDFSEFRRVHLILLKIITYVSQEWWRLMLSRIIVMN